MLERRVEVDVVGDVERKAQPRLGDARAVVRTRGRDGVAPCARAFRHERVQRRLREHAAEPAQVDDRLPVPPREPSVRERAESAHRIPSSCGSKNEQLPME